MVAPAAVQTAPTCPTTPAPPPSGTVLNLEAAASRAPSAVARHTTPCGGLPSLARSSYCRTAPHHRPGSALLRRR
eukprot:1229300-Prymnesium_polylepis.1